MNTNRRRRTALLIVLLLAVAGCGKTPPNLTPPAERAWHNTRILKVIDLLRDVAQDGAAQPTPFVSQNTAITITEWHESTVKIMQATLSGWEASVGESLNQVFDRLPLTEQNRLRPYFQMTKVILSEVANARQ